MSFPLIILAASLTGYLGVRSGSPLFQVGSGHGAGAANATGSLPGEVLPAHARSSAARLALWLIPVAALLLALETDDTFSRVALFLGHMAMVTFGGAYAVLACVAQRTVEHYGWLRPGEMWAGWA